MPPEDPKDTLVITLASTNADKARELNAMAEVAGTRLGRVIQIVVPEWMTDIDETGKTFEENALLKAQGVSAVPGSSLVLGEDSGFVVEALAGSYGLDPFPGVYSSRWLTPERYEEIFGTQAPQHMSDADKNEAVLTLMKGRTNRHARYVCAMVAYNPATGHSQIVSGSVPLAVIEDKPRGGMGFGYDPIVIPLLDGTTGTHTTHTMAELDVRSKNQISHRGQAFQALLSSIYR